MEFNAKSYDFFKNFSFKNNFNFYRKAVRTRTVQNTCTVLTKFIYC